VVSSFARFVVRGKVRVRVSIILFSGGKLGRDKSQTAFFQPKRTDHQLRIIDHEHALNVPFCHQQYRMQNTVLR
jgi:hypothetical protein